MDSSPPRPRPPFPREPPLKPAPLRTPTRRFDAISFIYLKLNLDFAADPTKRQSTQPPPPHSLRPHSFLKTRASQATVSHPTCLAPPLPRTRRRLALRAKMAAAPRHNHSPDRRPAAETALSFASIHPMVPLIFSRLALGVKKIGNRRPARQNRFAQDILQHPPQHLRLFLAQLRSPPHRMNPGSPQTFVRINISDSPQHALIQQQRLDMCLPRTNARRKLLRAHQQRLGPKCCQLLRQQLRSKIGHAPKAPRVRVAQLTSIIKLEPYVRVLRARLRSPTRRKLPSHSQMHQRS